MNGNVTSPFTHTGLTTGKTYYFVLTAANFGGEGPESSEISATPILPASFSADTNFPTGDAPVSVAIGDLNGDGRPDLAVANEFSANVSILLGDGAGSFGSATNFAVGSSPRSVAIGDLNGDGNPDLAVASEGSDSVSVLLNTTPLP